VDKAVIDIANRCDYVFWKRGWDGTELSNVCAVLSVQFAHLYIEDNPELFKRSD
jgi:hypothetical protein